MPRTVIALRESPSRRPTPLYRNFQHTPARAVLLTPRKILVVDDDDHSRFLLGKTLLRRFPQLVVLECIQGTSAATAIAFDPPDLAIVRSAQDMGRVEIVRALRQLAAELPLVVIAATDDVAAREAGATRCLPADDWLQIGAVVSDVLAERTRRCA